MQSAYMLPLMHWCFCVDMTSDLRCSVVGYLSIPQNLFFTVSGVWVMYYIYGESSSITFQGICFSQLVLLGFFVVVFFEHMYPNIMAQASAKLDKNLME